MKVGPAIFALAISASLVSCATPSYYVSIDSITSGSISREIKYAVVPGMEGVSSNDLQFREYAGYVKRALESRGFNIVEDFEEANVVIFLSYGIGNPQAHYQTYTHTVPTWGQIGGGDVRVGRDALYPTYGVTGVASQSGTYATYTYTRHIAMGAYDLDAYRSDKREVQLWRTIIMSTGTSGDLRQVFPIMVAASTPYLGENTGKKVEVFLKEDDKRVIEIKGVVEKQ